MRLCRKVKDCIYNNAMMKLLSIENPPSPPPSPHPLSGTHIKRATVQHVDLKSCQISSTFKRNLEFKFNLNLYHMASKVGSYSLIASQKKLQENMELVHLTTGLWRLRGSKPVWCSQCLIKNQQQQNNPYTSKMLSGSL